MRLVDPRQKSKALGAATTGGSRPVAVVAKGVTTTEAMLPIAAPAASVAVASSSAKNAQADALKGEVHAGSSVVLVLYLLVDDYMIEGVLEFDSQMQQTTRGKCRYVCVLLICLC